MQGTDERMLVLPRRWPKGAEELEAALAVSPLGSSTSRRRSGNSAALG